MQVSLLRLQYANNAHPQFLLSHEGDRSYLFREIEIISVFVITKVTRQNGRRIILQTKWR
ncbi:hypothetical protein C7B77_25190 [Chamaesiphon polymorphus CCALA 037]|uniref:Uncharacterized protein n=1 Tax=Chamaesiphon polymorphus CCALA 037 TaxID=2107692 RepID=A0A2T1FKK0_9CYAN|nr:hypothetical protein C7B77_25190 [Chamaesiphon polymorphus CCALA 037]